MAECPGGSVADSSGGDNPEGEFFIGVMLALGAAASSNLGINFQKYGFLQQDKLPKEERVDYMKIPYWWFGLSLVFLGALGDLASLSMAPQSVVTTVGSFTLVCNCVFAHFWLGEHLTATDIFGTIVIMGGATLAAVTGNHTTCDYTVDQLVELYNSFHMLSYLIVVAVTMTALYKTSRHCEIILKRHGPKSPEYESVVSFHALGYAGMSGMFGAQSVLLAKSASEIIKMTAMGDNQLSNPISWFIFVSTALTVLGETHWLATGLRYFDALYIVPVFQCFYMSCSVLGGALYFRELEAFTPQQFALFPLGVVGCLGGVLLLSRREMQVAGEDDEQEEAAEAPNARNESIFHPRLRTLSGNYAEHLNQGAYRPPAAPAPQLQQQQPAVVGHVNANGELSYFNPRVDSKRLVAVNLSQEEQQALLKQQMQLARERAEISPEMRLLAQQRMQYPGGGRMGMGGGGYPQQPYLQQPMGLMDSMGMAVRRFSSTVNMMAGARSGVMAPDAREELLMRQYAGGLQGQSFHRPAMPRPRQQSQESQEGSQESSQEQGEAGLTQPLMSPRMSDQENAYNFN